MINTNRINKHNINKHTKRHTVSNPCLNHISNLFILGIIYWLLVGFPITSCRVELHFGSWLSVPILGFSLYLTISPSVIPGCVLFFLAVVLRCQLTHKYLSLLPASVGLIWVTLCSVEFYLLIMLSICLIQLVLSCVKESNLLHKLSLIVLISLSTIWAWVVSLTVSLVIMFYVFADLI